MRCRWLFAFLIYLTLDLSNPFVAGAFNFNPDECVEAYQHRASSAERADASALDARRPVVRLARPLPSPVRPPAGGRHSVLEWLVEARAVARATADPAPSEDH